MLNLAKVFARQSLYVFGTACSFAASSLTRGAGPKVLVALIACWVVGVGVFVATFFVNQSKKGPVLLPLGRYGAAPALKLFAAAGFLLLGFLNWFTSDWIYTFGLPIGVWWALWGIAFAVLFTLECFYTLQIVRDGMWLGWRLFKWDDLDSFQWKEGVKPSLVLQTKYRHSFLEPLPIPVIHKDAVSNLLEQHGVHQMSEK